MLTLRSMLKPAARTDGAGRQVVRLLLCALAAAAASLTSGCSSTPKPAATTFATVQIHGNTPGQIQSVVVEVFQKHGYQAVRTKKGELVFDKLGTRWTDFAYGDWMGSPTWMRLRIDIRTVAEMTCRVECRPYLLLEKDGAMEEERPMKGSNRKAYQELLDEVAAKFNQRPG